MLRNGFLSRDMDGQNLDRQRGKESVWEGQRARTKAGSGDDWCGGKAER